ncbi:VOC family protein [Ruegeria sp. Ofav3-42]|uniref:VOC family protein n=1 Tax=Ruegeria sp. Ofav3-42 TaxID=2917759 RepID=UPI001EF43BDC|nr:VOC family protein [Ruegeria sp. Ofav3-42]MCG7518553.1 VOC family protein [Ruegeria sp. Ofav3-42]
MNYKPKDFLVWGELPVRDMEQAIAFYSTVTGATLELAQDAPNPMAVFNPTDPATGVALHLHPGKPAEKGQGPTLHLAAEGALEDVMKRVEDAGGKVVSEPIQIPAGRFFYATDPDGNSVGFFEGT